MLPEVVAGIILLSLVVYALLAGADFGGGVWDLFARGPRARAQREVVAHAIGPVWEANHVWMIVAVVLLFTAFPTAFAVIMTALHIPVTLLLMGIVLRGSSFVFRKLEEEVGEDPDAGVGAGDHDGRDGGVDREGGVDWRGDVDGETGLGGSSGLDAEGGLGESGPPTGGWQRTFAVSSLVTPVMLGVVLGALSTPAIGWEDGVVTGGFFRPWLAPFPWAVGFLTLALFAFLAAVYLVFETRDEALREDFRSRALWSGAAVGALGVTTALLARGAAPEVWRHLVEAGWGRAIVAAGAVAWAGSMLSLARRRWITARLLAMALVVLVLAGWGFGMHPWLVAGAVGIREAAAPEVTLRLVVGILAGGTVILVPAFAYLYWTFKRDVLFPGSG